VADEQQPHDVAFLVIVVEKASGTGRLGGSGFFLRKPPETAAVPGTKPGTAVVLI